MSTTTRKRRKQRQRVPHRLQRWLGATSYRILEELDQAWPRLTVSTLADRLQVDGWSRNTTHKIRSTLEARRLVVRLDGDALELTDRGRLWLQSWPECPVDVTERPTARKVLRALESLGGEASTVQIAEVLGVTRQTTGRWLRMVAEAGGPVRQTYAGVATVWTLEPG